MSIFRFHVPGEAARREYSVYIVVICNRKSKDISYYVGKTGDNRAGNNPVISRFGNHLSFNPIHSQVRTKIGDPENHDFEVFATSFGAYRPPSVSRDGVDLINELERRLNRMAQDDLGAVLNPFKGTGHVPKLKREQRSRLATKERVEKLKELIDAVKKFRW